MEFLLLGLAALFCAPLLEKKDVKPPEDEPDMEVIILILDKHGKGGTKKA